MSGCGLRAEGCFAHRAAMHQHGGACLEVEEPEPLFHRVCFVAPCCTSVQFVFSNLRPWTLQLIDGSTRSTFVEPLNFSSRRLMYFVKPLPVGCTRCIPAILAANARWV
jgi:hypothetical protein